jgi:hypothetical protein
MALTKRVFARTRAQFENLEVALPERHSDAERNVVGVLPELRGDNGATLNAKRGML